MKSKEKIKKIHEAIDALIALCDIEEIDAHDIVHSEKSTVSKLRTKVWEIEMKDN